MAKNTGKFAQVQQTHIRYNNIWYVSDLPGHNGHMRIKVGSERNSDWGYVTDAKKAIRLSPYWQRRFAKNCRDVNRPNFRFFD